MAEEKKQQPLATVDGREIYPQSLNELIMALPPQQQSGFKTREGRRALLDELIAQDLFYLEALDQGLDQTEEFQEMVKDATEKLLKTTAIANFMKDIKATDEEVLQFYNDNKDLFSAPEAIRASHILVEDEDEANKIIKMIQDGEKSFEEAAKEFSTCPSAPQGGDLDFFTRGQMVPPFEIAAFALENGEMTPEPVETNFGYHIIKKTGSREAQVIPFPVVRNQAETLVLAQKQDKAYKDHVEELKKKYPVELNKGMI